MCGVFAVLQDACAEALAGEGRINEDGADLGGICRGVKLGSDAVWSAVTAEECFAIAPTAAACDGVRLTGWVSR